MKVQKKILVLLTAAALLAACKGNESAGSATAVNDTAAVSTTAGGASVQELSNEQIQTAQREFLKVLTIKDQSLVTIMAYSQSVAPAAGTKPDDALVKQNAALLEDKMFQETLKIQGRLNALKVTNQDIKNYISDQSKVVDLGKKVYAAKSQIEKESKDNGKLSESSETLLKNVQAAQAKVLQDEMVLTDNLAQKGDDNPAREILQLKRIQNKEALQLAAVAQTLFSDSSAGQEEKAKKYVAFMVKANADTISELKKITLTTPDVEAYRQQLVTLAQLKAQSLAKAPQLQKQMVEKKVTPEAQQMLTELNKAGIEAEAARIKLTAKYAQ